MNSPILVTGAAGFIGFHLSRRLLDEGHRVVGLDSLNGYYPVAVKRQRLAQLTDQAGFTFEGVDLADAALVGETMARHRPEVVCHLAAQAGVRYSLINPCSYTQANVEGTLSVLEACRHQGVRRLVYASSSSVYGTNTKLPFSETDPVDTPVSLYAATKRSCELMAHTYTHLFGFQTVGHRFFTVYGPWGRPDMALWEFTERVLGGQPIRVFNNGQMQRDFTHISDIVNGVRASLFADGLAPWELFNLGNHRTERLLHMIELIEEACGRPAQKVMLPMQPGDVAATYADVDKARRLLGFQPDTTLDEGVPQFVEWYRSQPELTSEVARWRAKQEPLT